MNLGMQANIGQTQEQTLSPALLQSVKMLQKTSQELETAIKEEVEVNPLLEVDDGDFDDQEVPVDKDPEELDPRADSDEFTWLAVPWTIPPMSIAVTSTANLRM